MTEPRHPFAALPAGDPGDAAAREARHAIIRELLAAHADGELPAETAAQLDAHLVGCASCRRELALQGVVGQRLAEAPVEPASAALRGRIAAAVAAAPPPRQPARAAAARHPALGTPRRAVVAIGLGVGLAVAAVAGALRARSDGPGTLAPQSLVAATDDALLRAVLADYRQVTARDLPGRARDLDAVRAAVPFAVEPVDGAGLRLLAAWTAEVGGEAVAVLAYRWQDEVVVQYAVAEAQFFRSPAVRAGVAGGRVLAATGGGVTLVGWPTASAGTLVVGALPAARLATLRPTARPAATPPR